jgi:DNA-binding CsgD family transcriptional regulator
VSVLEQELEELGGDLLASLDDLPVPAILLDGGGMLRWQNRESLRCRGDLLGADFVDYVAPGDQTEAREIVRQILLTGEPVELRLRTRDPRCGYSTLEFSAIPVRGGGRVVGIFGLARPPRRARRGRENGGFELTERQREILVLLSEGRSTTEMAKELGLTQTTVRNYVAQLLAALGAHTRLQAVVVASREGLLDS